MTVLGNTHIRFQYHMYLNNMIMTFDSLYKTERFFLLDMGEPRTLTLT